MNRLFPLAFGIFLTWAAYGVAMKHIASLNSTTWPGTFGDSFGALNTLFTGLAFSGLIVSLSTQRKELTLQREELTHQRHALEEQGRQLASQAESMKRSAEAQERTAVAQERAALAQTHGALIAAKSEDLRATISAIEAMGDSGDHKWLARRAPLQTKRDQLIAQISEMTDPTNWKG
ncbi:hypothetical protein HUA76_32465 [Myxococcus sp. CA056]|uniref:hypothetical protein n=1 Tax=Myxococcus sp. CA056 TaxID=2741740 RepID=UPI00157B0328|nr:hypothetical protein [Myxococcus sp. CA056]NTX15494.1 hypothetical protein [Myxococcus sp. CA056]